MIAIFSDVLCFILQGIILREMTRFTNTAATKDHARGQTNCRTLAINRPDLAINNADSHEFIAENTPSLTCAAGVSIILYFFFSDT